MRISSLPISRDVSCTVTMPQLVVVLVGEGSGGIRDQVSDVSADEIQITRLLEQAMTMDMAAWAIAIELDKSVTISDNVSVTLSRLDWE